ncbi:hypothetical protein WA026_010756 [Henosepilachna vigintioctopunctata]|uniref:Uncharacterized protein n=1 Tax=Henosepilachna vigintioctopunctata TaxID=420089 RepID=A0AAW1UQ00_9CUCU
MTLLFCESEHSTAVFKFELINSKNISDEGLASNLVNSPSQNETDIIEGVSAKVPKTTAAHFMRHLEPRTASPLNVSDSKGRLPQGVHYMRTETAPCVLHICPPPAAHSIIYDRFVSWQSVSSRSDRSGSIVMWTTAETHNLL